MKKYVETLNQIWLVVMLLAVSSFYPSLTNASTTDRLNKTEVETRLNYLVGTTSFSATHLLSQERLMELVSDIGFWGDFPNRYKSSITDSGVVRRMVPGCDDYITRLMARRFLNDLLGQDLQIWRVPTHGIKATITSDKLGWYYNTATTMYERPTIMA